MNETINPIAEIELENGKKIIAELYPDIAPQTVRNIIYLANELNFYDNLIFHRCIPDFVIQGGCPQGNGMGGPGYSIKGEFKINGHKNELPHTPGVLSMARAANYNSGGSQFFICVGDCNFLDNQYAAFGRVTEGIENAYEISNIPTDSMDKPKTPQKIKSIRVEVFGVNYPKPEMIK